MNTLFEHRHFILGPLIIILAFYQPPIVAQVQAVAGVWYIWRGVQDKRVATLEKDLASARENAARAGKQADKTLELLDEAQAMLRDSHALIIDLQARLRDQPLGQQAAGGPTVSATGG